VLTGGSVDQTLHAIGERRAPAGGRHRTPRGDGRPDARVRVEQSLLHERRDGSHGRIGVDLQFLAQRSHGRKAVAGPELARDHRLGHREDDLLVQ